MILAMWYLVVLVCGFILLYITQIFIVISLRNAVKKYAVLSDDLLGEYHDLIHDYKCLYEKLEDFFGNGESKKS